MKVVLANWLRFRGMLSSCDQLDLDPACRLGGAGGRLDHEASAISWPSVQHRRRAADSGVFFIWLGLAARKVSLILPLATCRSRAVHCCRRQSIPGYVWKVLAACLKLRPSALMYSKLRRPALQNGLPPEPAQNRM